MNKNQRALTPPMGWNSWDCYGASVTEEELLGNAEYMAENLKQFGWEYIVCDIQWYEPTAESTDYHKFTPLVMDEYSRLLPAVNRFPSAKDGKGFRPIADKVHALGLKFGIHIMRGIPRQAAHQNTKILGTTATAREIAHPYSICSWNTDMYGVDARVLGAQEYYNSLFELYASWEIDFVKVDDICVTEFKPHDLYSAKEEIEMIAKAIENCGRDIVLSLSPGPAMIEHADHLREHANMWRMTGDLWDNWPSLKAMFDRCRNWAPFVSEGCWPDCDMLPLGHIAIRYGDKATANRMTFLTKDEQRTMITLWSIFRSPLMMGGEMRDNDEYTLSLLTNEEVLYVHRNTHGAKEIQRVDDLILWRTQDNENNTYIAAFNIGEVTQMLALSSIPDSSSKIFRDLWEKKDLEPAATESISLPPHGAVLYKLC